MLFGVISLKIFGKHNSELPQTNQQLTSNDESSFSSGDAPYFLTYYTSQWIEEFYLSRSSHRIRVLRNIFDVERYQEGRRSKSTSGLFFHSRSTYHSIALSFEYISIEEYNIDIAIGDVLNMDSL
ncbi:2748_t:CDS:2 [Rhizophagus irregularis]|nr:2748_t:CDS:2 [Rhizophagus irregularis]